MTDLGAIDLDRPNFTYRCTTCDLVWDDAYAFLAHLNAEHDGKVEVPL